MAIYLLEGYNTDPRYSEDIRYREYTISKRRAELFNKISKIQFSDSGHGIVFSATEHRGHRKPCKTELSKYVNEQMMQLTLPKAAKPKRELDLLFGVTCADCHKLITIHVTGTRNNEVAVVRHGDKPCEPAMPNA